MELMLSMGSIVFVLAFCYLRERSWALLFIFPLALNRIPVSIVEKMAPGYILGVLVLIFFVLLSMMGKLRLRWRGLWYMDALVLIVFLAFLLQYLRYSRIS